MSRSTKAKVQELKAAKNAPTRLSREKKSWLSIEPSKIDMPPANCWKRTEDVPLVSMPRRLTFKGQIFLSRNLATRGELYWKWI